MTLFGIPLLGFGSDAGRKVLLTLALVGVVAIVRTVVGYLTRHGDGQRRSHTAERVRFWTRQGTSLLALVVIVLGGTSIWFDDPGRLATVAGLATAGVAVALQRVLTAFAAYLIILRGRIFTVGDRITMSGVRGDVVDLGFMQTTVMEMGEPPAVQGADPPVWVTARQYTGRIVRVTNDRIFDSPVYNYTREFHFLWEEIRIPVRFQDDRAKVERILLDVAEEHVAEIAREASEGLARLRRRYLLPDETGDIRPAVYLRITDNWIELTLRFPVPQRGIRPIKDAMSRDIMARLDAAGIGIASATYDVVGFPPVRVEPAPSAPAPGSGPRDGARRP